MLKREEVAWVFLDVCIEVSGAFELGGKGGNDTRVAAEACSAFQPLPRLEVERSIAPTMLSALSPCSA